MVTSARGFVLAAVLFVSSLLYATTLLFPALILLVPIVPQPVYRISRGAYRRWCGWVGYLFFAMASYMVEHFCNIKIKVTGDRVAFGEPALVICNHRTRVDWVFLWCLCLRQGQLSGLKIVLKDSLKGIPGFGWAAQPMDLNVAIVPVITEDLPISPRFTPYEFLSRCKMLLFIFLARKKAKDVRRLNEICDYLIGLKVPTTMLIFPEGTDLSPSNHLKSLGFAKKQGLAEYQYVMHPKVRGFAECLQALRPGLSAVHDVTIAYHNYGDGGPPSEKTMLSGAFPPEVHMHVRRKAIQDLPADDERLEEWCREAFKEKETRLKEFHQGQRRFDAGEQGDIAREEDDASSQRSGLLALLFFISLLPLVLAYGGTIFGWYAVSACCACTVATSFGGWDTLELWWSGFSLENFAKSKHD